MNLEKAAGIVVHSLTPNRPYHVQWMVTRRCNYRCQGCNVWREQSRNELSAEEIKKGLDILRDIGVIEIVFSGGNPLLREDIEEILDYASRFFITTVYDNGSMAAKKIEALRKVDFVAISIDSLDPAKNDYIKGVKGSWKNAINTVQRLQEERINVVVTPTISQINLYEIVEITKYFSEKGIPLWYCLYSYDLSGDARQLFSIGKMKDEFIITDRKGMVQLCESLAAMKRKNNNILMTSELLRAVKNIYLNEQRNWRCRALQNFFMIDHLGNVAGCHLHKPVASIFELPRLWDSEKFDALRRFYRACTQCTYLCYIFYSIHGSVFGNLKIAREHWKNARLLFNRTSKPKNPKMLPR